MAPRDRSCRHPLARFDRKALARAIEDVHLARSQADVIAAVAAVVQDRDQLWAEGAKLFAEGGVLWAEAETLARVRAIFTKYT